MFNAQVLKKKIKDDWLDMDIVLLLLVEVNNIYF